MVLASIKTAAFVYVVAVVIGFMTAFMVKIMFTVMKFNRNRLLAQAELGALARQKQNGVQSPALDESSALAQQARKGVE